MYKKILAIAAILAALSVALGAMGAHALENVLSDKMQKTFETAARYQMYHSIALAVCGVLLFIKPNNYLQWAARLFIAGIVLFSGSLYLLVFLYLQKTSSFNFFGAITPLGGLCFIAAWICIAIGAKKWNTDDTD
jgi:uncharacterized membrane protein YgdD (TMEM256/DUF423 family)